MAVHPDDAAPSGNVDADARDGKGRDTLLEIRGLTVSFASRFGEQTAIENIDMDVRRGEIVGLVGESGAGKSTIGSAINGLLPGSGRITGGSVTLAGERLDTLSEEQRHRLRGDRISMIFQDPQTSLNPLMRIGDQLIETIRQHRDCSEEEARRQAVALLEDTGIADASTRMNAWPHQFSGGMRQRVVIALALCTEPELIIADEPTTALDVSIQKQILALIRRLADERQVGIILITHDIGVIAEISDRVVVLRRGEVKERGETARVLGSPADAYTRSLMAAVPRMDRKLDRFRGIVEDVDSDAAATRRGPSAAISLAGSGVSAMDGVSGKATSESTGETSETGGTGGTGETGKAGKAGEGAAAMSGKAVAGRPTEAPAEASGDTSGSVPPVPTSAAKAIEPLWRVSGASATVATDWLLGEGESRSPAHDPILALENVDVVFDASPGYLFGLGRRSGVRALDDVSFDVAAGSVLGLVGESGSGKSTLAKTITGLVTPTRGALRFDGQALPFGKARGRAHPSRRRIQMIFQDPYSSLNERHSVESILTEPLREYDLAGSRDERRRLAASVLELVGLPQRALLRYPHQFSGGQRQRIAVARALLARPELLIADEPTSALDVSVQAQILNLLKDLQKTFGLSMLFISHNLAVVRQMADRIVVLKQGQRVEYGDSEAFFESPDSAYGRELLSETPSLALLDAAPGS